MKQPQKTTLIQRFVGAILVAAIVVGLYTAYDQFFADGVFNIKQTGLNLFYFTVLFFIIDLLSERLKIFIFNNMKKK